MKMFNSVVLVVSYLFIAVPLKVASRVKLLRILIWRHITTRPVASLHRLMLNLQNGNENFSGLWNNKVEYKPFVAVF